MPSERRSTPFVSVTDVAGSYHAVAGDLVNITERLSIADQTLSTNYRPQALNHYYAAYKITKDAYGKDSAVTQLHTGSYLCQLN